MLTEKETAKLCKCPLRVFKKSNMLDEGICRCMKKYTIIFVDYRIGCVLLLNFHHRF